MKYRGTVENKRQLTTVKVVLRKAERRPFYPLISSLGVKMGVNIDMPEPCLSVFSILTKQARKLSITKNISCLDWKLGGKMTFFLLSLTPP